MVLILWEARVSNLSVLSTRVFNKNELKKVMKKFTVYTKDPCPYCVRAIRLLKELNLPFVEIDLTDRADELMELKKTYGWQTVPLILWDGELVGGYTDLKEQIERGRFREVKP
jgi:glutaredoxin 3